MIALDRTGTAWRVQSGAYGVFALRPGSRQIFLFEVGPGDLMEGLELEGWTLRATPLEASEAHPTEDRDPAWAQRLRDLADLGPEDDLESLGRWLDDRDRQTTDHRQAARADRGRRLNEEMSRRGHAFDALGHGRDSNPAQSGQPWFRAASLVGAQLGVPVRSPVEEATDRHVMEAVARASRCRVREVDLAGSWWTEVGAPLVGVHDGAPTALLRSSDGGAYDLVNPESGQHIRVDASVASSIDVKAWVLYRPLPSRSVGLAELLRFSLEGRGAELRRALAWGLALALVGMVVPIATGLLIDSVIPGSDRGMLAYMAAGLLALAFGRFAFELAQGAALVRLDSTAEFVAHTALWDRLLRLPLGFFRRYSVGDLLERVSAVRTVSQRLTGVTLKTVLGGVLSVLNLGLLVYYSPSLAAVALAIGLLTAACTIGPAVRVVSLNHELAQKRGRLMGRTIELIRGMAKLRAAGAQEWGFSRWAAPYRETLSLSARIWFLQDTVAVVRVVLGLGSTILLYGLAVSDLGAGMTAGSFLAFISAFGAFQGGLNAVSETFLDAADVLAYGERTRPILEALPEVSADRVPVGPLNGRVEVDRVAFRYREGGPPVLDQVSIRVEPGEFVAVVGPSGAGKSTLLRMLLGFDAPVSGRVLYDGRDLSGLDPDGVRRQIGVVLQSAHTAAGSVLALISGARNIGLDDAWAALDAAGVGEEIRAMPMGLHTVVSDGGGNLSGGQMQRILIAKALVAKPSMLFFDEATSALDNRVQKVVTDSLLGLGVSRLVIAHRLSTIRDADRIYVMDAGRVVQEGTFDDLSSQPGLLADLMARQLT